MHYDHVVGCAAKQLPKRTGFDTVTATPMKVADKGVKSHGLYLPISSKAHHVKHNALGGYVMETVVTLIKMQPLWLLLPTLCLYTSLLYTNKQAHHYRGGPDQPLTY